MDDKRSQNLKVYLDEEAFAELEKQGKIKLSPELRTELNDKISESIRLWEWHEAYSPVAIKKRINVASLARQFQDGLGDLSEPAYLSVMLSDDEGQDEFRNPQQIHRHRWKEVRAFYGELNSIIERTEKTAPDNLIRRSSHPEDRHLIHFCRSMKAIYEGAGGKARIGSHHGPFARFLKFIHPYLPRGFRPASEDAMVDCGRKALAELEKSKARQAARQSPQAREARIQYRRAMGLAYRLHRTKSGSSYTYADIASEIADAGLRMTTGSITSPMMLRT